MDLRRGTKAESSSPERRPIALLDQITQWARLQPDIVGLALVGSHARGTATVASDIDLVLLTDRPQRYLEHTEWAGRFGEVRRWHVEDWGMVTSVRVGYATGPEVEFGFTTLAWATPPIDEGTRQVVSGGLQILLDREGLLGEVWTCR